jgi:hypothetical protein
MSGGLDDSPKFPPAVRAVRIGEEGFVAFLHELRRLGVLTQPDVIAWLALHGAVLRRTESPLDTGEGIPDVSVVRLGRL